MVNASERRNRECKAIGRCLVLVAAAVAIVLWRLGCNPGALNGCPVRHVALAHLEAVQASPGTCCAPSQSGPDPQLGYLDDRVCLGGSCCKGA
ncbi:MAG TPA: hypothetical protein VNI01_01395, partial [Elusimicrobiota bacterium]|nr:hypothetical protein [Elusimicrobiota bacterium]